MVDTAPSPQSLPMLGILAGGGTAPVQLINACRQMQRSFFVICLEGHADSALVKDVPHAWMALGSGAVLKDIVATHNIKEIVMIGRVRRPSLSDLKPDWMALKALTKVGLNMFGDDALLRSVSKVVEEETGARIIGAHEVFADLLTPEGVLGKITPDDQAQLDITRGQQVLLHLSDADVGQAVIVQTGVVLGVEAIEGTDALIARTASLKRTGAGGVLVKIAKAQQDNRFDLPTIGPETVKACQAAGVRGIAVEAGRSLCLERDAVIAAADAAGIFVIGIRGGIKADKHVGK